MMKLNDSTSLALTKLRTRKLRNTLSAVAAGLVFGILIFGSMVFTGFRQSLKPYLKLGYGGRYFVQLSQIMDYTKIQHRADQISTERYKKAKEEANRLGQPAPTVTFPTPVDFSQASSELYPQLNLNQIKVKLGAIKYKKLYEARNVTSYNDGSVRLIVDGKERGAISSDASDAVKGAPDPMLTPSVTAMNQDLLAPFTFPGESMNVNGDGRIPALIPFDLALKFTSESIPKNAMIDQRLAIRDQLRRKLTGSTLSACFRNASAASLLTQATQQAQEIALNKTNKSYVKPALVYAIPQAVCQPVTVASDTRSSEEKAAQAAEAAKQPMPSPHTELVHYKVVGFVQGSDFGVATSGFSLSTLFQTGPFGSTFFPLEQADSHPILKEVYFGAKNSSSSTVYAEVNSVKDYKAFIAAGCYLSQTEDPAKCLASGHWFQVSNYGNPTIVIQDFEKSTKKGVLIAVGVIAAIAMLIMMTTIGKVMADSRQETGVFRAIGAKRFDIAQIYIAYSILLATAAFLIASALALAAAFYLSARYSGMLASQAVETFGSYAKLSQFTLIGVNVMQVGLIYCIVIGSVIVASLIPLARNLGRNPIKAMREG